MKVLFFLSIELNKQATSGHLIEAMIKAVCQDGHSVHIIQKMINGKVPVLSEELLKYKVTTDYIPFDMADKGNFVSRYLKELEYVRRAGKKIQSDYEAVFIQSTTVAGLAVKTVRRKLPNAIITFNVQDVFPYNLVCTGKLKCNNPIVTVLSAIQRYGYNHSDYIITISEDMKDLLVADGTDKAKIKVIYNWSYQDEPYESVDIFSVEHIFNKDYFNVVYAGNIGVMQNVDVIIKAAKYMKKDSNVWFHIIGNGVHKKKLIKMAKDYSIKNISFWPMQPSELAPAIYSGADVNIIPLVKDVYRTALPSKTATCLACGKPIILAIGRESKFGKRIAEEAGAVLIDSNNPFVLAKEISKLKNHEVNTRMKLFYKNNCGITNNSKMYAKIIEGNNSYKNI